jgi:hypothetical protein
MAHHAYNLLIGKWNFGRQMSGQGCMSGSASFVQTAPGGLSYQESGLHQLAQGETVGFYQQYFYRHEGEDLIVRFADNRPFHALEFYRASGVLHADAHHLCGADTYKGRYIFHDSDRFSLIWDVRGPKKNYIIETEYKRQGSC